MRCPYEGISSQSCLTDRALRAATRADALDDGVQTLSVVEQSDTPLHVALRIVRNTQSFYGGLRVQFCDSGLKVCLCHGHLM